MREIELRAAKSSLSIVVDDAVNAPDSRRRRV
jgi:hypothetical protein